MKRTKQTPDQKRKADSTRKAAKRAEKKSAQRAFVAFEAMGERLAAQAHTEPEPVDEPKPVPAPEPEPVAEPTPEPKVEQTAAPDLGMAEVPTDPAALHADIFATEIAMAKANVARLQAELNAARIVLRDITRTAKPTKPTPREKTPASPETIAKRQAHGNRSWAPPSPEQPEGGCLYRKFIAPKLAKQA